MATRKIVQIDEEKCNGCGLCIPNCAEGALQIIDGKAKLISDKFCDGLGACLGHCPQDAITVSEREAEEFNEKAVEALLRKEKDAKLSPGLNLSLYLRLNLNIINPCHSADVPHQEQCNLGLLNRRTRRTLPGLLPPCCLIGLFS